MTIATLDDALVLMMAKFHGMLDKAGQPYALHCLRVMLGVTGPLAQQVAVMHDLVEDTDVTLEDLRQRGFAEEVVQAVALVTHTAEMSYADYVVKIKSNKIARQVKLADLRDNYSLHRVAYRESSYEDDAARIQRYILSYQFLTDTIDQASYLRQMVAME